ncbi:hypothetical protein F7232_04455 [Corynebacterium sp. 319]|uniref:DUF732 domain-containing protein n=1 Tax=unclassified Corynebacterium TaxID=2624378 RepID=UPI00125CD10A|nr:MULTISPECIES: DUF732 domain-containing protein [unclassified Corynebacterium]KAB1554219.1 hypothetical protein F7232_04455 [Corynebacterium sp. 319]KAB3540037.1 hypothetical protein F8390_01875 [Corynebacterium sp. 366]
MARAFTLKRTAAAAAVSSVLLCGLAACGSDTVDNSAGNSETSIPSVTVSSKADDKNSDKGSSSDKDDKSSSDKDDKNSGSSDQKDHKDQKDNNASSGQNSSAGGEVVPNPRDGSVDKVDEVPRVDGRTEEDKEFLKSLKDKNIDLSKAEGGAKGMEDSLIAAGRSYCRTSQDGQQDLLVPVAAGQLETKGIVKGDPRDAEKIIVDAAKSAYCG